MRQCRGWMGEKYSETVSGMGVKAKIKTSFLESSFL